MMKKWLTLLFLALACGLSYGWNDSAFSSDYEEEYAELPPAELMETTFGVVVLPQVQGGEGLITQYSLDIQIILDNEFEEKSEVEDYDDEGIYETNVPLDSYKPSRSWNIHWAPLIISTLLIGSGTAMILYFDDKAKKERDAGAPDSLEDYNTRHDDIRKYQTLRNWGWGIAIAGTVGFTFSLIF